MYTTLSNNNFTPSIILDGVRLVEGSLSFSSASSTGPMAFGPIVFTLTFESSLTVYSNISATTPYLGYILQTV